jgi:hypothetical protein
MRARCLLTIVPWAVMLCGCEDFELLPLAPGIPVVAPAAPAELCAGGALSGAEFTSLGFPRNAAIPWDNDFAIAVIGNDVLLGTGDGLFRRSVDGSLPWMRSGLRGRHVRDLLTVPGMTGIVLAASGDTEDSEGPFHRSMDDGHTWQTGRGDEFIVEHPWQRVPMMRLARQPGPEARGMGLLYASMTARNLARSSDGGATWDYVVGGPDASTDDCVLHIPEWDPDILYQGCNAMGSYPAIGVRDISDRAGSIGEEVRILDAGILGDRPAGIIASTTLKPGVVSVGIWKGMLRIVGDQWSWFYRYDEENGSSTPTWADQTEIKSIWIDPCDANHVVFGGDNYGRNRIFALYETFDDGVTVSPVDSPLADGRAGGILEGAAMGPGNKDVVLLVRYGPFDASEFEILVRRHSSQ